MLSAKPAREIVLVKHYRHPLTRISTLHGAAKSILIWEGGAAAVGTSRGGDGRSAQAGRGHGGRGQGLAQGQGDSRVSVQGGLHLHRGLGQDQYHERICLIHHSPPYCCLAPSSSSSSSYLLLFPFSTVLSGYNISYFHFLFLTSALFTL